VTSNNNPQSGKEIYEQKILEEKIVQDTVSEILSETPTTKELGPLDKLKQLSKVIYNPEANVPIWGDLIIRKKVTHITGDPGIGKTTFTYALGLHISNGMPFLNIKPHDNKPVKVLVVDFESEEGLGRQKYDQMGEGFPDDNFRSIFEQEQYIDSPKMIEDLVVIHKSFPFDIMFIDNQGTAFPVRDENDNAEAIRHIKILRKLAFLFNCGIVVYHHPSKSNNEGLRKGSGAFAWVRYCDISANMNEFDPMNHMVQIEYTKNRYVENAEDVNFQKMGDSMFERKIIMDMGTPKSKFATDLVKEFVLTLHGQWQRKEIVDKCRSKFDYSEELYIKTLGKLIKDELVKKVEDKYGYYEIP